MKLETFFEKFDHFADAPAAVAKMRELVLDLAVQGKVADQDPNDEHAAELLNRLIQFKLDNPLTGRSGRSNEGPVEVEAISDGLPPNWVNTTIGEVLYVIRGASPRPKGDPQYFSEERTPYHWVKISDIRKHGQNGLLMDTDEFLTEAGMRKSVLLPRGTLVLTNSATIGVPIVLGIEGCCIHDGYLAFPNFPHDLLSQKFLLYLFHTLKKHAERNARGLAQLNLNTDLVRSFPFGLPPLAEQMRIVAKVDELMALCDRLEAQQQERETRHAALARASLARFAEAPTSASLDVLFHPSYAISPAALRNSVLMLAIQGKLVPQDPSDEPAEAILRATSVLFERLVEAKKLSRPKPLPPVDADEMPFSLPIGWAWCRLGQIMRISSGDGLVAKDMNSGPFPVYGGNGVNGYHDAHNVEKRTLVIGRVGFYCGSIHVTPEKAWVTDNAFITTFDEEHIDLDFLSWLLRATDLRERDNATAQPVISGGKVYPTVLGLPPLAEQRQIVAKVNELMTFVDALESQLATARTTAANLLAAAVAELTNAKESNAVAEV